MCARPAPLLNDFVVTHFFCPFKTIKAAQTKIPVKIVKYVNDYFIIGFSNAIAGKLGQPIRLRCRLQNSIYKYKYTPCNEHCRGISVRSPPPVTNYKNHEILCQQY